MNKDYEKGLYYNPRFPDKEEEQNDRIEKLEKEIKRLKKKIK